MRDKAVVRSSSSAVCTKREAGREGAQCNRRDRMNSRAPKCPNTRLSPNFTVLTCTYASRVLATCPATGYLLPGTCSHIRLKSEAHCPVSPCSCESVICRKTGILNTDYKTYSRHKPGVGNKSRQMGLGTSTPDRCQCCHYADTRRCHRQPCILGTVGIPWLYFSSPGKLKPLPPSP